MLILALILSIAGTAWCIWMEAHPPPRVPAPRIITPATAVIVQMIEESGTEFDDDPPTVVQTTTNRGIVRK